MNNNFLQSAHWRKFQEAVGRRTFFVSDENFSASIIEHKLPIVGKYFYVPKGPVMKISNSPNLSNSSNKILNPKSQIPNKFQYSKLQIQKGISELVKLAKENKAGWIRIEPDDSQVLDIVRENWRVRKAPHDMQPKEILVIDITKTEEELLAEMKSKTRYNIKLSLKHNVLVKVISNFQFPISNKIQNSNEENKKYINEFLRLNKIMAKRQGIKTHPDEYYRKMFETIPSENIKLYAAEHDNQTIAANIIIHYGETATYLHGASDDKYKNLMAPYLLQWRQIQDAKKAGMKFYDFGGIKISNPKPETRNPKQTQDLNAINSKPNIEDTKYKIPKTKWSGITRFKIGFAPGTEPKKFPGSYDIILNPAKYWPYRIIQSLKSL